MEGRLCPSSSIYQIDTSTTTTIAGPGTPASDPIFTKGETVALTVSLMTNVASEAGGSQSLSIATTDGSLPAETVKLGSTESYTFTIKITGAAIDIVSKGFDGSELATVDVAINQEQLKFLGEPVQDAPSAPIISTSGQPVRIEVLNSNGALETDFNGGITVALANDASASGATLSGTLTETAQAGIATFGNLSLNQLSQAGLQYTLSASLADGTQTVSTPFSCGQEVVFSTQPSNAQIGDLIEPFVQASLVYPDGHTAVPNFTGAVNLALGNNPAGAKLEGTLQENAVAGVATFNNFALTAGGQGFTLQASIAGVSTVTSSPFDVGDTLSFVREPTNAVPGQSVLAPVTLKVLNPAGAADLTSGNTVTLSIAHDGSGAGAALGGTLTEPVSTTTGEATFSNLSINLPGSGYTLEATLNYSSLADVANAVSTSFSIQQSLAFGTQPSSTPANSMMPRVVVQVLQPDTNLVDPTYDGPVTLEINPNADPSSGVATLSGGASITINAVNGIATFNDLSINTPDNGYSFLASIPGGSSVTSNTFNITAAATDTLAFKTAPSNTTLGAAIKTPVVDVELPDGKIDAAFSGLVSLDLSADPTGEATLGGTTQVMAVKGVASFPGLTINQVDSGFTIKASLNPSIAVASAPFSVAAPSSDQPYAITSPTAQYAQPGAEATFTAQAVGLITPVAEWEESTNGFKTYTVLTSGVTTNTVGNSTVSSLTLSGVTDSMNDQQYRAVFTVGSLQATSASALLGVLESPAVATNPTSGFVGVGGTIKFTAVGTGTPAPSVVWEESADGGKTFEPVSDAKATQTSAVSESTTTATLTVPAVTAGDNDQEFIAAFTNALGSIESGPATLVDVKPTITLQPVVEKAVVGGSITFTANATGIPAPTTASWEILIPYGKSDSGVSGGYSNTAISNGISSQLALNNIPTSIGGLDFYAIFSTVIGGKTVVTIDSRAAVLEVGLPSITANPTAVEATAGGTATFTAAATGAPNPHAQWQVSGNDGVSYTNIPSATSTTLSIKATGATSGDLYRAVFSNGVGSTDTTAAMLTVAAAPIIIDQPLSASLASGQTAIFTTLSAGYPDANTTVQWYESTDGGAVFNAIPNATSDVLDFGTQASDAGKTYQFYAVFTNSAGIAQTETVDLTIS